MIVNWVGEDTEGRWVGKIEETGDIVGTNKIGDMDGHTFG